MARKQLAMISLSTTFLLLVTSCQPAPESNENPKNTSVTASDVSYGASDYTKVSAANNQLGFALLNQVPANKNNNRLVSPISLFMALTMVYNGADGDTKDELSKALSVNELGDEELNKANASLQAAIQKSSDDIVLNIANSLWLNDNYQFESQFAQTNRDYFNAEIAKMDIHDSKTSQMINDWVMQASNGTIDSIVEPPLDTELVTLLINTIYFNGNWTHGFKPDETESDIFHTSGNSTQELPFMKMHEELSFLETDDFKAVSLPYGDDEMSMDILLPKGDRTLKDIQEQLTLNQWESWQDDFSKQEGTIRLPKFDLTYETSLTQTLKKMGVKAAFEPEHANLSNMLANADSLVISDVIQKTYISVNEEGTEASGATAVEVEKTSASAQDPFQMKVNRPFLLMIQDNETDVMLFIGAIHNPK